MEVLTPQPLRDYLQAKARLHQLSQDLVLFYAKQIPTVAVWLHYGTLRFNFEQKSAHDSSVSGLYFLDELSNQTYIRLSAKVLAGSKIWLLTRTEIEQYLVTL